MASHRQRDLFPQTAAAVAVKSILTGPLGSNVELKIRRVGKGKVSEFVVTVQRNYNILPATIGPDPTFSARYEGDGYTRFACGAAIVWQ